MSDEDFPDGFWIGTDGWVYTSRVFGFELQGSDVRELSIGFFARFAEEFRDELPPDLIAEAQRQPGCLHELEANPNRPVLRR